MTETGPLASLLANATRALLFTGKGGVGKTSLACATALSLAARGRRVLLVSTDPASNLDEALGVALSPTPVDVPGAPGLLAMNLDPEAAAHAYRERIVGPYRNLLPEAAVRSIEEQLSGACTVEVAAFDEFAALLGDAGADGAGPGHGFDHIVFDTAPTGHTLRLLELPAAWSGFLASNAGATSCLGPLSGLQQQKTTYESALAALRDGAKTTVVLVARPDLWSLAEAARTWDELRALGLSNGRLIVNGLHLDASADPVAAAFAARGRRALANVPDVLRSLPRSEVPLLPLGMVGLAALRSLAAPASHLEPPPPPADVTLPDGLTPFDALVRDIAAAGRGAILTMGKGGVGKTTLAVRVADGLARLGHQVNLTTTDPADHLAEALADVSRDAGSAARMHVSRIDPHAETAAYMAEVLATAGKSLDPSARALLEEELRSPCTQEIAVFRAFARTVDDASHGFVVIDTAPTGHTLLLLDAAQAYHREVTRTQGDVPPAVARLLPRLRDPEFTKILIVALPEATPVHEAMRLEHDLARAGIRPYAWIVNQSLLPLAVTDPVLAARRADERRWIGEVLAGGRRTVVVPWGGAGRQDG
ncbi:MAG: arsenical pump-driving ATPase [Planctomycetes bacterium]|nr:arsenical pump-driving ATPase [Planctomycetota bacterium]